MTNQWQMAILVVASSMSEEGDGGCLSDSRLGLQMEMGKEKEEQ